MDKEELVKIEEAYWECMERFKRLPMRNMLKGVSQNEFAVIAYGLAGKIHPDRIKDTVKKEIRVSELVNKMHWSMPAASRLLKGMEEKGYIIRKTDEADRRNTLIVVTEKGEEIFRVQRIRMDECMDRFIEKMGPEDMWQFIALQNKMSAIIKEELDCMKQEEKSNNDRKERQE